MYIHGYYILIIRHIYYPTALYPESHYEIDGPFSREELAILELQEQLCNRYGVDGWFVHPGTKQYVTSSTKVGDNVIGIIYTGEQLNEIHEDQ